MNPTIYNCEGLASTQDRKAAEKLWKKFQKDVENLFDQHFRSSGGNHLVEMMLLNRYVELLDIGFEDNDAAQMAQSEYLSQIENDMAVEDTEEAYRYA